MRASRKTYRFFLWIIILSVPFYAIGKLGNSVFPVELPISALMVVCPTLALCIHLPFKESREIFYKCFELRSANIVGYVLAILTMPVVLTLTFFTMRYTGIDLPSIQIFPLDMGILVVLFFTGAVLEEIGWAGYATNALLKNNSVLRTGFIIGIVWAVWHLIPYLQMGKEYHWIFWQCTASILKRIVMVWLFLNYGRSVLMNVLFHMQINLSAFVFPKMGSHYDPFYFCIVFTGVVLVALGLMYMIRLKKSIVGINSHRKTDKM